MEIYKICPVTVNLIAESMKCWKTTLHLNHAEGSMTSRPINIKSGIFQGDSLSLSSCGEEVSASGPWFGLGPKDSKQTLRENIIIIIIALFVSKIYQWNTNNWGHYLQL